jgi:NADH-quinone oxidoreductase subunit J
MLLDLKAEQLRKVKVFGFIGGIVAVGGIIAALVKSLASAGHGAANPTTEGDTHALGTLLFTQYTLPFEIVSVLLLVAMIGVILLSKKKLE